MKGDIDMKITLEDDPKRAFPNLLSDTKVVTNDTGCSCRLRSMGRGRGYYMRGCHHELKRDRRGKGVTKAGTGKRERDGKGKGNAARQPVCAQVA
jgi:hypothetical protein